MSISEKYTLSLIKLNGNSAVSIYGINSSTLNKNVAYRIQHAAGIVDPGWISVASIQPTVSIVATELAKILGVTGSQGVCIGTGQTCTSVDFYYAQMGQCAPRLSGTNHFRVSMSQGILVPTQIQASQSETATIGLDFHAVYDGTNDPMTFSASASLPSVAALSEAFTMGKVTRNGSQLSGVQSFTIDFGLKVDKHMADGDLYPTFAGVASADPVISGKGFTLTDLSTMTLGGTAQGSTDSVVYLQACSKNGGLVAAATASHISVTVDDGMLATEGAAGSNNESQQADWFIRPIYDGSNANLAIATGVAIS